jgi:hypothetical protein
MKAISDYSSFQNICEGKVHGSVWVYLHKTSAENTHIGSTMVTQPEVDGLVTLPLFVYPGE